MKRAWDRCLPLSAGYKWNTIDHRLFSFISKNWRGKPLLSFEVIVNLIAATTAAKRLKADAELSPAPIQPEPESKQASEALRHPGDIARNRESGLSDVSITPPIRI
jgi:hypothetical protein